MPPAGQLELQLYARTDSGARGRGAARAPSTKWPAFAGRMSSAPTADQIEAVVGALFDARGWRYAVAESCTGGLVTSRLTDIPGSSAWVERAVVTYSNATKV